jgi:hypothetical protein
MRKRLSTPILRKAKSSTSLNSPGSNPEIGKTYAVSGDQFTIVASPITTPNLPTRQSMDTSRPMPSRHSQSIGPLSGAGMRPTHSTPTRPMSMSVFGPSSSSSSVGKAKGLGISMQGSGEREGPEGMVDWLKTYKATDLRMDVGRMKKLRMCLRHENTGWVARFLEIGGYELILARLRDLLEIEWRCVCRCDRRLLIADFML